MLGHGPISSAPISGVARIRNIPRQLEYLDSLKRAIDELRPLGPGMEDKILQYFRIEWNYHSNSIEGNSYTFGETRLLLMHGLTASGKPLKDSLEIRGHNEAIVALEDFVKSREPVTEAWIRSLHQLILGLPYQIGAITLDGQPTSKTVTPGKYKEQQNHVRTATGELFYFAEPHEVQVRMADLVKRINESTDHPAVLASLVHYDFVTIHPFDDGNGRIARLLMNLILMRAGYPPTVIKTELKEQYFEALHRTDVGDNEAFTEYLISQVTAACELWLRAANGESLDNLQSQIRLFKASILRDPNFVLEDSLEVLHNFIGDSLQHCVEKLLRTVIEFAELFDHSRLDVFWITDAGITSTKPIYNHFRSKAVGPILDEAKTAGSLAKVGVNVYFEGLKVKGHRKFSKTYKIEFNLLTTPQGISGVKESSIFNFDMEEGLPPELVNTVVNEFSTSLMESVRKATD